MIIPYSSYLGWEKDKKKLTGPTTAAKKPSSDITKFAAELVKNGIL
jgi:hypothetical protein